jgi:SAM-dependent methyltransferase
MDGQNQKKQRSESPNAAEETVRAFYERMPYPAPLTNLDEHRELYNNPQRRRAAFHLIWPAERPHANQEILVAGCGTSQAARYALREPEARITAIDISENSLRYTRALQEKYQLKNLQLHQLSILDVQELGLSFDHIVCTGVLHHLADPDGGLCALRSVLKPDGAMQIMVYALYGRSGIYIMREYCRLLGIMPTKEELRDLATALGGLPEDHPLIPVLHKSEDFRHPDALADALLHPQERAYTVPQIYEWLDRCGMSFGRWMEQAPYLPQCGVLAKTPHGARLAKLPERAQHAAAELFRGTMTRHNFVAYRNDRSADSQPIGFSGEQWRHYMAIRLPWTVCIRDRLPAGSVAVLINRAHKYPDLALALSAAQYRLFNALDGERTLGDIIQSSGLDPTRSAELLEKLWQYDQIVFAVPAASDQRATLPADRPL